MHFLFLRDDAFLKCKAYSVLDAVVPSTQRSVQLIKLRKFYFILLHVSA
jgi:hypothetical protein